MNRHDRRANTAQGGAEVRVSRGEGITRLEVRRRGGIRSVRIEPSRAGIAKGLELLDLSGELLPGLLLDLERLLGSERS